MILQHARGLQTLLTKTIVNKASIASFIHHGRDRAGRSEQSLSRVSHLAKPKDIYKYSPCFKNFTSWLWVCDYPTSEGHKEFFLRKVRAHR